MGHKVCAVVAQVIKEAIYDAFYKLTDSRSQITAYVFDVVRSSVPRMDLDEIFVVSALIASSPRETLAVSHLEHQLYWRPILRTRSCD